MFLQACGRRNRESGACGLWWGLRKLFFYGQELELLPPKTSTAGPTSQDTGEFGRKRINIKRADSSSARFTGSGEFGSSRARVEPGERSSGSVRPKRVKFNTFV